MTSEEWNTALYEKMFAEQGRFSDWLKTQPPETILQHAYKYAIREDFLCALENNDLPPREVKAMLKLNEPLAVLFKEWDNQETSYMDRIWDTFTEKAQQQLQDTAKSTRAQER